MGAIPRIEIRRRNLPAVTIPKTPQFGPAAFRVLGESAEAMQTVLEGEDKAEAARLVREGQAAMEDELQQSEFEAGSDPNVFNSMAREKVQNAFESTLGRASNARSRALIQNSLGADLIKADTKIRGRTVDIRKDKARGDHAIFIEESIRRRLSLTDPEEQRRVDDEVKEQIGNMEDTRFLTSEQAARGVIEYHSKVDTGRLSQMAKNDPEGLLTASWEGVDPLVVQRYTEQALNTIKDQERRKDDLHAKVKKGLYDNLAGVANSGKLRADMIIAPGLGTTFQDALEGKAGPYLSATQARELKRMNDHPVTQGGEDKIDIILDDFFKDQNSSVANRRLDDLRAQGGDPKNIRLAREKVATWNRIQRAEGRAVANKAEAEQRRLVMDTIRDLDTLFPKSPVAMMNRLNEQKKDEAAARIRRSGDPRREFEKIQQEQKAKAHPLLPNSATQRQGELMKFLTE